MNDPILRLIEQKKYTIFGSCESISAARGHAENLLKDSHRHDVAEALDVYHNTLLNELETEIRKIK